MSFSSRDFRDALACFATGVTVISITTDDGRAVGLTANSFSSVSLEPPLVLWCLGKDSDLFAEFERSTHFAVNVLDESQADLSQHFATRNGHLFDEIPFETWVTGAPIMTDALAALDCEIVRRIEAGDHWIYLGEVKQLKSREGGLPLLYVRSRYGAVKGEGI